MNPNQQNQNQNGYSPQPEQAPADDAFYPNQQPTQPPAPQQQPQASFGPQAQYQPQPTQPSSPSMPQSFGPQPQAPQQQPQQQSYGPQPTPTYAVDYLEQIAPPPPRGKFLSGSFGKIIIGLGVVLVFAVSLIVAFGGQNKTADLETLAIKFDNAQKVANESQKYLKNEKLSANNSNYMIWLTDRDRGAYELLAQAGVQKKSINKQMVAAQTDAAKKLSDKFTDARLNAQLDSTYAREMAYQTQLLKTALDTMSKRSQAKAIRDYAKTASANLVQIQKNFADYKEETTQ